MSSFNTGEKGQSNEGGISLIEIMVVTLLISVLFVAAIPLSRNFFQQNEVVIRQSEIIAAINYSRNKAIELNKPLLLTTASMSSDWSCGMILIVDSHQTGNYSEGDKIIHRWKWRKSGVDVSWNGFRSNHFIEFQPTLKSLAASGHFVISAKNSAKRAKVTLNRYARIIDSTS